MFFATTGRAAGYESPVSSSARHLAVGGAAIGGVDDATSTVRNPAGLGAVRELELTAAVTALLDERRSVPPGQPGPGSSSDFGLLPLGAVAVPVTDWLAVGLAGQTVARVATEYESSANGVGRADRFAASFFELSPALSLTVPEDWIAGRMAFGVGYRITFADLFRFQDTTESMPVVDADTAGVNASGVRLGFQYSPIDELRLGVNFENAVTSTTSGETGVLDGQSANDLTVSATLPLRVGGGIRLDLDRWGFLVDYEFAHPAASEALVYEGVVQGAPTAMVEELEWRTHHMVRAGVEHRWSVRGADIPIRGGYAFETAATPSAFPSTWSGPPAPTHAATLGAGYETRRFSLNLAFAYRFGDVTLGGDQVAGCELCSEAGVNSLTTFSLGLDASYRFDL